MNNTLTDSVNATPRFRGQILRQIYRVWLFRTFLPVLIVEVAVFSFILYGLARQVFFQRIIENAMNVFFQNPSQVMSFFLSAFIDAGLGTKVLVVAVMVALALVIRQITQGLLRFILVRQNYFAKVSQEARPR
jgi:ABC-type transport system involved in multi-copper enzyme maturation permease subunit